jgi:hypothetical protein
MATASRVFELEELAYAVALQIGDFQSLGAYACSCRLFARIVDLHRRDIYTAHTEEKYDGRIRTFCFYNKPHRGGDLPAMIYANGTKLWYRSGLLHRGSDRPAEIWPDGSAFWYRHGELHRGNDWPAMILDDGTQRWYWRGQLHRDGDKPAETRPDGSRFWYQHGDRHRNYGSPAIVRADGSRCWYHHGQLLRETKRWAN